MTFRIIDQISSDSITHQYISGVKATPIYLSAEVLLNNEYSKSRDVYAFGFIAYEIICNEVPFSKIANCSQVVHEAVVNSKRPIIKGSVQLSYRQLIEKCWAQEANECPSFDEIVHQLRMDRGFIFDSIDKDDYLKYIKFIDDQLNASAQQKFDERETRNEKAAINELRKVDELEEVNEAASVMRFLSTKKSATGSHLTTSKFSAISTIR